MVQLQKNLGELEASGIQVVGISYDSAEVLRSFGRESGISFPLLSDPDSATIKAYGIHDKQGYPHPGTYLVEQDGTVIAALFLDGYRDRHDTQTLIDGATP